VSIGGDPINIESKMDNISNIKGKPFSEFSSNLGMNKTQYLNSTSKPKSEQKNQFDIITSSKFVGARSSSREMRKAQYDATQLAL
jgi:hypothetical protein